MAFGVPSAKIIGEIRMLKWSAECSTSREFTFNVNGISLIIKEVSEVQRKLTQVAILNLGKIRSG